MRPLDGVRVLELEGIGPGPLCCCMLADWGADVTTVCRASGGRIVSQVGGGDPVSRGKRSIALDMKAPAGLAAFKALAARCDVLIEPFRPGVCERMGIGPDDLCEVNPRLVYGRMTGWGQGGDPKVSGSAGHDSNYLALSGALSLFVGETEGGRPVPPVNFAGDYAGGALMLAFGVLLALHERHQSGRGQVVDAAMTDGAAYISLPIFKWLQTGFLPTVQQGPLAGFVDAQKSVLNQAPHFGRLYECADGKLVAVQALEPQFYRVLLGGLGLDPADVPQFECWLEGKECFARAFKAKTRDEWAAIFYGTDACVAPVLSAAEAAQHPHNVQRQTFVPTPGAPGLFEPAPAPKLSRTPGHLPRPGPTPGADTAEVLAEVMPSESIERLLRDGVAVAPKAKL